MPFKLNMSIFLSPSIPKWNRQPRIFWGFLRILEQLFKKICTSDSVNKLNWLVFYIEPDVCNK